MKKMIAGMMIMAALCASADTSDRIRANAKEKWPNDYTMQAHEVKSQTDARNKWEAQTRFSNVPNDIVAGIRERTENKWGDDFVMKVHVLNAEIDAWKKLNKKN